MKKTINYGELTFVSLLLVFTGYAFVISRSYSYWGKLFPTIAIVAMAVLLLLKFFSLINPKIAEKVDIEGDIVDLPKEHDNSLISDKTEETDPYKYRKELLMVGWVISLLGLYYLVGFVYAMAIFLFSFLKIQGKHSWLLSISLTAAMMVFVYILFQLVLSVPFPEGILL